MRLGAGVIGRVDRHVVQRGAGWKWHLYMTIETALLGAEEYPSTTDRYLEALTSLQVELAAAGLERNRTWPFSNNGL